MQAQIDYITVDNTMSASMKGGIKINKGIFIGTKKYLFFVPEEIQEHSSTEVTATIFTSGGKLASEILIDKFNEGVNFSKKIWTEEEHFFDVDLLLGLNSFINKDYEQMTWLSSAGQTNPICYCGTRVNISYSNTRR